jgi:lipopolysaccharide export LptBFGC system permease protein LptF
LIVTAVVHSLLKSAGFWPYFLGMFFSNVLLGWITLEILRASTRKQRLAVEAPKPVAQH